jgi:hypothetical protein
MRTLKVILPAMLLLLAITAIGWTKSPVANIVGSAHDLTSDTWSPASSYTPNLCFFCHIVHKTATNSTSGLTASQTPGAFLWNHTISSVTSYGVYTSGTFDSLLERAGVALPTDLGTSNNITTFNASNLCLGCHDGTVAIASFYEGGFGLPANNATWNNGHGPGTYMYTGFQLSDLSKTHPVNFQYTPSVASAGGLTSPANPGSVDGNGEVPLFGNNYMMQCATCHDPHNGTSSTKGGSFPFAQGIFQTSSTNFCLYCHT